MAAEKGLNEAFLRRPFRYPVDTSKRRHVSSRRKGTGRLDCPVTYTANSTGPEFSFINWQWKIPHCYSTADSNSSLGIRSGADLLTPISATTGYLWRLRRETTQATFGGRGVNSLANQRKRARRHGWHSRLVNPGFVNQGPTLIPAISRARLHANVLVETLSKPGPVLASNASGGGRSNVD